jgi:hypothetical protein
MKRYNIDENGVCTESPNGMWVLYDECSQLTYKINQYHTILERIEQLQWYRIDEGPKLAKWALDNYER